MGGDSPPPPPPPPAPPPAPNYAAANREAVQADIDTLPTRRMVEQAAKLGRKVTLPDGREVDFTGLGDEEAAREAARVNAETADLNAQSQLDVQRKYGAAFNSEALKRLQEIDPTGFKTRQDLAQVTNDELALGSKISPQAALQAENDIRGGQAARGNILGNAPLSAEVLGKFELGEKLKQQRLSNAQAYVLGTPLSAQYQNLQGAQQQTAPYQPVAFTPGANLNPNAGAQGAQFAQGVYGSQVSAYNGGLGYSSNIYGSNVALASRPNPWLQLAGTAIGAAAGIAA